MKVIYRQHAVKRMHERSISEQEVETAIANGTIINTYPNDEPYPSYLLLGKAGNKTMHVVYADDSEDDLRVVITVYEPDIAIWLDDFKTRR